VLYLILIELVLTKKLKCIYRVMNYEKNNSISFNFFTYDSFLIRTMGL